jgi:predicted NBD/HSP70 family sugar kinase
VVNGEIELSDTERAVLSVVVAEKETTRPAIRRVLELSAPTVGAAIARLIDLGLVSSLRTSQGALGRAAAVYGVAHTAGWLLGLDVGSTRVKLNAQGLDGRRLVELSADLEGDGPGATDPDAVVATVRSLLRRARRRVRDENGPLRVVGIALPRIIPEYLQRDSGDHGGTPGRDALIGALGLPDGVPVLLENNVNCAALAEMDRGAAQGHDDFVYLQVGVGIGAGIVADRRVLRGSRGGAGEVSALPIGWPSRPQDDPFALEHYLGSRSLLARCREAWDDADGPAPASVPELFLQAEQGAAVARQALAQHAEDIAQLALTLGAVVDPALIVLGGGVGQSPMLTEGIRAGVQRFRPDVDVVVSALGDAATVEGAVALTADYARSTLLGPHHERRLDVRTAVVAGG